MESPSFRNPTKKETQKAKQIINAALEAIDLALRQLSDFDQLVCSVEAARRMQTKITNACRNLQQETE